MDSEDDPEYDFQINELLSNTLMVNHLQRLQKFEAEDDDSDEAFLALELSNEDMNQEQKQKRKRITRERQEDHDRLVRHYFGENPRWDDAVFERRFRMSRERFLDIC